MRKNSPDHFESLQRLKPWFRRSIRHIAGAIRQLSVTGGGGGLHDHRTIETGRIHVGLLKKSAFIFLKSGDVLYITTYKNSRYPDDSYSHVVAGKEARIFGFWIEIPLFLLRMALRITGRSGRRDQPSGTP